MSPADDFAALIAAGQREAALALVRRQAQPLAAAQDLLARWPEHPTCLDTVAGLAFEARAYDEAIAAWQRMLALAPTARGWNNLGSAQLAAGLAAEAEASFAQALALDPDLWPAHYQLAGLLLSRKQVAAALPHIRVALPMQPKLGPRLYKAALALASAGDHEQASAALAFCCEQPETMGVPVHEIWASYAACRLYADEHQARSAYFQAGALAPASLGGELAYAWPRLMSLPYVYADHAHVAAARAELTAGLEDFAAALERRLSPEALRQVIGTLRPPFLLAYQGGDDRELMERIGSIWTDLLARYRALLGCERAPRKGRLRVGFVSRFFYAHSVMVAFSETIAELAVDPDFEVICIQLDKGADSLSEALAERVSRFVRCEGQVSARAIAELELDILIYPDIGMDHLSYQLALHRLAPIQCLLPGHPVTSGLPAIDYFLSPDLCEPKGAQAHYSETLARAPACLYRFAPTKPPDRLLTRAELGLPADRRIYYCPMTLFKLHPDFDALIAGILAADAQALVLLPHYRQTVLHQRLQARLKRSLGPDAARVAWLPWLDRQALMSAILAVDVLLDSYSFSGGTTSQMVLSLGQPLVTLPSPYLRGRVSSGFYLRVGMPDLISHSPEAYINQAVRLGQDLDYRRQQQERLRGCKQLLSNLPGPRVGMGDFLREVAAAWPGKVEGWGIRA